MCAVGRITDQESGITQIHAPTCRRVFGGSGLEPNKEQVHVEKAPLFQFDRLLMRKIWGTCFFFFYIVWGESDPSNIYFPLFLAAASRALLIKVMVSDIFLPLSCRIQPSNPRGSHPQPLHTLPMLRAFRYVSTKMTPNLYFIKPPYNWWQWGKVMSSGASPTGSSTKSSNNSLLVEMWVGRRHKRSLTSFGKCSVIILHVYTLEEECRAIWFIQRHILEYILVQRW